MARAVTRTLRILEILSSSEGGLTHGQIAKILNIPKSSVTSVLSDMVYQDFVSFEITTKRYTLSTKIVSLAHNYLKDLDIIKIGAPIIDNLAKKTGESVAIYIQSGTAAQLVYKKNSPQAVLRLLQVGALSPMYAIAAGKVILAHLNERELEKYLSSITLKALMRNTITDPEILRDELEKIRKKGIAYNYEEFEEGVIGIAAPVYDLDNNVVAAITVVSPSYRFNDQRKAFIEKVLKEKTARFSLGIFKPLQGQAPI